MTRTGVFSHVRSDTYFCATVQLLKIAHGREAQTQTTTCINGEEVKKKKKRYATHRVPHRLFSDRHTAGHPRVAGRNGPRASGF